MIIPFLELLCVRLGRAEVTVHPPEAKAHTPSQKRLECWIPLTLCLEECPAQSMRTTRRFCLFSSLPCPLHVTCIQAQCRTPLTAVFLTRSNPPCGSGPGPSVSLFWLIKPIAWIKCLSLHVRSPPNLTFWIFPLIHAIVAVYLSMWYFNINKSINAKPVSTAAIISNFNSNKKVNKKYFLTKDLMFLCICK